MGGALCACERLNDSLGTTSKTGEPGKKPASKQQPTAKVGQEQSAHTHDRRLGGSAATKRTRREYEQHEGHEEPPRKRQRTALLPDDSALPARELAEADGERRERQRKRRKIIEFTDEDMTDLSYHHDSEEEQEEEQEKADKASNKGYKEESDDDGHEEDKKEQQDQEKKKELRTPPRTPPRTPNTTKTYPRSILTPARKRKTAGEDGAAAATPRKSVVFNEVVVREFERLHNGSGGVPTDGAYPLGLSWVHADDVHTPVTKYEVERTPKRKPFAMPLTKSQRRDLLNRLDETMAEENAEQEVKRVQNELCKLQSSRLESPGCRCKKGGCLAGCPCYDSGMPCLKSFCKCAHCYNPFVAQDVTDDGLWKQAQELQEWIDYFEAKAKAAEQGDEHPQKPTSKQPKHLERISKGEPSKDENEEDDDDEDDEDEEEDEDAWDD